MDKQLVANIIIFAIGLLASWLITGWYYRKSQHTKTLCWTSTVANLVNSKAGPLSEVSMTYRGSAVQWPQIDRVYIWNAGNQTINGSDISEADPLRLTYSKSRVLEVFDVTASRTAVSPRISDTSLHDIKVAFDFLDPGDGIRLSITLDADSRSSWKTSALLQGSIRGLTHGIRNAPYYEALYPNSKMGILIGIVMGGMFLAFTTLICVDLYLTFEWSIFVIAKVFAVLVCAILTFATFALTLEGRPKSTPLPQLLRDSK